MSWSAAPPAGQPPNAGELPIGYLATTGTNVPTWRLLESSLTQTIEPSTTWTLNLCVWRGDIMTNAPGVYQGLFKVTEANGLSHSFVPIKATVEGY